jgi:hypothetical protein
MYPHARDLGDSWHLGVSTFLPVITEDGYHEVMLQATPSATQSSFRMDVASAVSQTRCPWTLPEADLCHAGKENKLASVG